ncbi:membrane protein insertion efficiency factor YidD [Clostridium sp. 'deep sea']|uniref:membrane protein insertion efficiency factor YidD n=1 Tax=Clostridium sp. 'deep sea' TaxID=2779445 RepID=UPI0018966311|nr:membrane protein insertion efficiency factor YidD [Clostridium sp. 'deep sea']QOR34105.1 membrane protein insertion efficiency factor YidD [Clostridium sp. 'deep sea']
MQKIILQLIKFYQKKVSPSMGAHCRFRPTCSQYAYEAISRFGLIKGGIKALWRVMRCNPLFKGGYDPVK